MRNTVSSCYSTLSGTISPVSLVSMTDWNSTSIYITLDPRPLSKERINHSVQGRPSAGPRKPLITGSSSLQCRPLIVLSKNRCACSLRSAARLMEALSRRKGFLCHVALLKHPAPTGGHLNSPPAPRGCRYSSTFPLPAPHCKSQKTKKKKHAILNKVETGFPLHPS